MGLFKQFSVEQVFISREIQILIPLLKNDKASAKLPKLWYLLNTYYYPLIYNLFSS